MIAPWPPKPRHKAKKRLREAVNARAQTDALAVGTLIRAARTEERS